MRRTPTMTIALGAASLLLAGCGAPAATTPAKVRPVVEQPWVRTTDEAKDKSMTALFLTLVNPSSTEVRLTSAACADAGVTEIHEMVMVDGKMVMRRAENGVAVEPGKHQHLKPGGYHVMLMKLARELPIGAEVSCTLTMADGTELPVTAPVKQFTEEEDHYHDGQSPSAVPSGSPMAAGTSQGATPTPAQP